MGDVTTATRRAALVYALRSGWSRAERDDLTDACTLVAEIMAAHGGQTPTDLKQFYGDEFEALDG